MARAGDDGRRPYTGGDDGVEPRATGDRRGYAWSPKPPRGTVDRETTGRDDGYRRLQGPWHIYFRSIA